MTRLGAQRIVRLFGRVAKTLIFLTLIGQGSILLDNAGLSAHLDLLWKVMSSEGNLGNIDMGLMSAYGGNNVALY